MTPSSAKYSHWIGTRTPSAATSAFTVRRERDGGQSMRMYSNRPRRGSMLLGEPVLATLLVDELHLGADELAVGGHEGQVRQVRLAGDLFEGGRSAEPVVGGAGESGLVHPETGRGVPLRVEVHEQDRALEDRESRRETDRRRRLADPALLVRDGENPGLSAECFT